MATLLKSQKSALRKSMRGMLANLSTDEIQAQSRQITNTLLALPEFQQSQNVSCFLSMPAAEVDTSAVVAAILHAGKNLYVPKTTDKERGMMDFFQIFSEDDLRALPRGLWGIREPDREYLGTPRPSALSGGCECREPLDLIVMPGVAFDRSLSRLGYGKGYYDRFLATYTASASASASASTSPTSPGYGPSPSAGAGAASPGTPGLPERGRGTGDGDGEGVQRLRPKLVALALREQILEAGQVPVEETDWKVDVLVGPDGIVSYHE